MSFNWIFITVSFFLLISFRFGVILTATDEIWYLYWYSIRSTLPFHSLHFLFPISLSLSRFSIFAGYNNLFSLFGKKETNPSIFTLQHHINIYSYNALDTFDILIISVSRLSFDKLSAKWIINIVIFKKIGPKYWRVCRKLKKIGERDANSWGSSIALHMVRRSYKPIIDCDIYFF